MPKPKKKPGIWKKLFKDEKGFILVISLGLILILMSYTVKLAATTLRMKDSIVNTNRSYAAADLTGSMIEIMRLTLKDMDAGYRDMESLDCNFDKSTGQGDGLCLELGADSLENQYDIDLDLDIRGRAATGENLITQDCPLESGNDSCFVVPFPGTGSAGKDCNIYVPNLENSEAQANHLVNIGLETPIDQIDHACNWNKLRFASSRSDRIAIPLYYETGALDADENGSDSDGDSIFNPFKDNTNGENLSASHFTLRLRTPCKLCDSSDPDTICPRNNSCPDSHRYTLNELDSDDIVVQWQLTGYCLKEEGDDLQNPVNGWEECGYLPVNDPEDPDRSAITESMINNYKDIFSGRVWNGSELQEASSKENPGLNPSFLHHPSVLDKMHRPILSLFLSGPLLDEDDFPIPHLEYQITTDQPISDASTMIHVSARVDKTIGDKKQMFLKHKTNIIDFAIQN